MRKDKQVKPPALLPLYSVGVADNDLRSDEDLTGKTPRIVLFLPVHY